jgi:FkbM family methyltransferase
MKTIFDLGLHEGWDTDFYLRKGFRVVAVEASPQFVDAVKARFGREIAAGQLVIVRKAIAERAGATIPFFVRTDKDGWSSIRRDVAERDGVASTRIEIETVTIAQLFSEFGVPYYLKCDIEGADNLLLSQIVNEDMKPCFISVEGESAGDEAIDLLAAAGYSRFQIVNQGHLRFFVPPNPPREGSYVPKRFHGKMSGLFGEELPPAHWVDEDATRARLRLWQNLAAGRVNPVRRFVLKKIGKATGRTWLINTGWIDIHARRDP